ncbi:putative DNA-binding transcriptional regulator YafY [Kitasatospora sp. GP30]|uniref:helix-turn-helix transcriptional regulator n=1 Tax=Kitasatospora sp. GP30 TaxID=3035084 RepID=UPI000C6FE1EE|nr:YafY family protein [Kitasatospora sp. GP30]MDH6138190.1 putative DNA-binding transcriptional regulator YafY [Kitasatospora sp. GP30]
MANTSTRTLRLLSLLQTHRYWPGTDLAERLGVSVRTLRRDIDRLRELGYPVEAQRGVDGGYQLAAGAALPPLVIDDDEAVALAVGLQAAAEGAVAGLAESSVRVLAKVVQVMPARLRHRVEALRTMTVPTGWGTAAGQAGVDPGALTVVALACRDDEQLRFGYAAADGRRTERHVEPHRLVCLDHRWYLVAYDLVRHDWRSFRVDRLTDPQGAGTRFRPRELPAADAAEFVRASRRFYVQPHRVEVLADMPAATAQRLIGHWCTIEDVDAGHCRIRMTADSLDWACMALGVLGTDFRVLHPPALLPHLRDWADRFHRAAREGVEGVEEAEGSDGPEGSDGLEGSDS